ncbi:betaine--homocysteine S-methyltransferase 1-like [Asterias amurensis]|uniref:betaine--homocysteine S-methyltransferase 1-like n=1 Tax=Asterias amurensis TaxID=7602 RepID=UPI003AB79339
MEQPKKGLLERLAEGVVVGDGSFILTMEKRGYATAGAWTPEACVLHPEAVRQLHREFIRNGSDVLQTFTFYSSDEQLQHVASAVYDNVPAAQNNNINMKTLTAAEVNAAAIDIAQGVAQEGGALVAGSVSPLSEISFHKGKEHSQIEFRKQMSMFKEKGVDFLLGEFFKKVEEAEWAIETMVEMGIPVACTMRLPPSGDHTGVSVQDCAVRMAKAGASLVGVNCLYDPSICLKSMALMKEGLEKAGLQTYLMVQPFGYHSQDPGTEAHPMGYEALPQFPYAMEPRALTRIDVHHFAREAYELGVRYIGGCCGFEPHHIKAIAEELAEERGHHPPSAGALGSWKSLALCAVKTYAEKANWEYWDNLTPTAGRSIEAFSDLAPASLIV